jgi:hypothetical protein
MLTSYTCSTLQTGNQLQAFLYPISTDPQFSNQRIIDFLEGISGGQSQAYFSVGVNVVRPSGSITFSSVTQPNVGGSVTFLGRTYTLVASSPTSRQFIAGATTTLTAQNLAAAVNNDPTNVGLVSASFSLSGPNPRVTFTMFSPGTLGNIQTLSKTLTSSSIDSTFSGGSNGVATTFNSGLNSASQSTNNFQVIISSSDSQVNMLQTLNTQSSNPDTSIQNLINLHNSFSYSRSTYVNVIVGASSQSATLILLNNMTASQTLTIAGVAYTAVASGATGTQFNIDASLATTTQNLYNALVNNANIVSANYTFAIDVSDAPASTTLTITSKAVGSGGTSIPIATTFDGAILNQFSGTAGTLANLKFGLVS